MIKPQYLRLLLDCLLVRYFSKQNLHRFRCNICGRTPLVPVALVTDREEPSCYYCGSNQRFRSIVAALSIELLGKVVGVPEMPERKDIVGLGISDSRVYAVPLKKKFSYTNTFFHKSPRLDLTKIGDEFREYADFVIASEVMEHIPPPVEEAFANLFSLLKPGGICILTVPYTADGRTREHFPDLFRFRFEGRGEDRLLVNRTREGEEQVFKDLCFHGGRGSTLEMRLFSEESLLGNLREAGCERITIHRKSLPGVGIDLEQVNSSYTISARKK